MTVAGGWLQLTHFNQLFWSDYLTNHNERPLLYRTPPRSKPLPLPAPNPPFTVIHDTKKTYLAVYEPLWPLEPSPVFPVSSSVSSGRPVGRFLQTSGRKLWRWLQVRSANSKLILPPTQSFTRQNLHCNFDTGNTQSFLLMLHSNGLHRNYRHLLIRDKVWGA